MEQSSHPLAAFRAALERRVDELIPGMTARFKRIMPQFEAVPDDFLRPSHVDSTNAYLDTLTAPDFEALRQRTEGWFDGLAMTGTAPELIIVMVEEHREQMLEIALDALAEGVPGAREGTLRLMAAFSAVVEEMGKLLRGAPPPEGEMSALLLRTFAEICPDPVAIAIKDDVLGVANDALQELLGRDLLGRSFASLVAPEDQERWAAARAERERERRFRGRFLLLGEGARAVPADVTAFEIDLPSGGRACLWLIRDVSDLLAAEEGRLALQADVIAAQDAAIRELSTPLLPLAEGVVAMPIVGSVDAARAGRILEALLDGIAARGARVAILDITGVGVVDTQVAEGLLRAARAARLLGTEVILTGIRGAVAETLVHLDVHFDELTTCSTLQEGVARALGIRVRARS